MKLSFKIMSIVFVAIFVLLLIDGYLSVRREVEAYENDLRHDTALLGHALRQLMIEAWRHDGAQHALEMIDEVNKEEQQVKIRWVWLDVAPHEPSAPRIPIDKLNDVRAGREAWFIEDQKNGLGEVYTYIPLAADHRRPGALELRESLAKLHVYTRHSIVWSATLTALLLSAGGIVVWVSGSRFIGRPLKELTEKTRRIGDGDLSADLSLHGHNELSDLAVAMNRMCEQLAAAQENVRKETEARIVALEQLRHAERLATIGRLSAGIAHELGTPLNVVTGRAKLMAAENLERDALLENSRIIREQVERMTRIIRQLLDFARRQTAKRSPSDIRTVIHQVLDLLTATASKQRVTLEMAVPGDLPMITIDGAQIQQVLMNLIMNGIQAMPNGGRVQLEVKVQRARPPAHTDGAEGDYVAILVRDDGVGISEAHKERLFEPFFTTKEVGKGTGLGLSIAYGIVDDHGGWIEVESEAGAGACFMVFLPMENTA